MLVELGLPGFNAVLHNAAANFNRRLGCSTNSFVVYVCNRSSQPYSISIMHSIELFFSSLFYFLLLCCVSSLFCGLLPDSYKWLSDWLISLFGFMLSAVQTDKLWAAGCRPTTTAETGRVTVRGGIIRGEAILWGNIGSGRNVLLPCTYMDVITPPPTSCGARTKRIVSH